MLVYLVFTVPNHFRRTLLRIPDKNTEFHILVGKADYTHNPALWWVQSTAITVQIKKPFSSTSYSREDKSLQQMEMGKEIPPEVWSDIRVHLGLCVDLSLWHMFSVKPLIFGGKSRKESAGFPYSLPRCCRLIFLWQSWNKKRITIKGEVKHLKRLKQMLQ